MTRITGTLRGEQYSFLIICHSVLLRTRNVAEKLLEKIETHILCSVTFFLEYRAVYETTWKNIVELHATDNNMAHSCFM